MRQFLRSSGQFLLFATAFYVVVLLLWGWLMPARFTPNLRYVAGGYGHMHTRLQEVKTLDSIDILFLGSSHAYRGFDPRIFGDAGYTVFNLGSSAQTPEQTLVLLRKYLPQLHPNMVIFEVYPATFANSGVESSLDLISNSRPDFLTLQMAFSINDIRTYNN